MDIFELSPRDRTIYNFKTDLAEVFNKYKQSLGMREDAHIDTEDLEITLEFPEFTNRLEIPGSVLVHSSTTGKINIELSYTTYDINLKCMRF